MKIEAKRYLINVLFSSIVKAGLKIIFQGAFSKGLEFLQAFKKKLEMLLSILISFPFISCLEINVLKNWLRMLRFLKIWNLFICPIKLQRVKNNRFFARHFG